MTDEGVLLGNAEEATAWALDLAAADAFNGGALDPLDAGPSLAAWEALRVPAGGFKRNDDGDTYDEQEWVFVDLRLAELYARACRADAAQALLDRVTGVGMAHDLVLPELLDPDAGTPNGPAPMIGFGAGAYVLAQHARGEVDCAGVDTGDTGGPDDTGDTGDTGSEDTGEPGDTSDTSGVSVDTGMTIQPYEECGCSGGAGIPLAFPAALAAAALVRRRRVVT